MLMLALWLRARLDLGSSFSVLPIATALKTRGMYRKLRNPMYLFTILANIGIIYLLGIPYLYLLIPLLLLIQIFRVKREEIVLTERFGQEYLDYRKRTWF